MAHLLHESRRHGDLLIWITISQSPSQNSGTTAEYQDRLDLISINRENMLC